tara:strand:+ start:1816 stop:2022 length:207 start_codon:yes stop_codon:yes gene_type:complete
MSPGDTLRQLRNIIYKEIIKAKLPAAVKVKMLNEVKQFVLDIGNEELKLVVNNKKGEKNATSKKKSNS